MQRIILVSAFLFYFLDLMAQQEVVIGSKHSIQSAILNEERAFWVYLPVDYNNKKFAQAKYPVVYLLDGESNFHSFTGMQESLSKGPYAMVPQMIVVGIINTDRTRDLTPTAAGNQAFFDTRKVIMKGSGGNKNFIDFLAKELRPYIDSACRTSGYNILTGHSFGGLTAVNILFNRTALFNAYIIIDPSLWWDNEVMLRQADTILSTKNFAQRNIYLAQANKEIIPQDTTTDMQRGISSFYQQLRSKKSQSLRWGYKYYEAEDHGTVPVPAAYDGLKFIFNGHRVHVKQAVDSPELVVLHFNLLSAQLGFTFTPAESYLDWMGNYCMGIGKTDHAISFYRLNIENYPLSVNAYLAMQKAFEKKGDNKQATSYEREANKRLQLRKSAGKKSVSGL